MNKKINIPFREKLLSQENSNTQLQKEFHREVNKMYTDNINRRQRLAYILTTFFIAFITFLFWLFAKMFEEIQIEDMMTYVEPLRLASTWAMFCGIALLVLSIWPAIRGKVGLRFYPTIIRIISCIFILAVVLLGFAIVDFLNKDILQPSNPMLDILGAAIISLLMIIMSIYMLLSGRIDRGYLKNKEKTLELEYRLTELEETLSQKIN